MIHYLLLSIISLLLIFSARPSSQDNKQKPVEINILFAETLEGPYAGIDSDALRLIGNVSLRHEDVLMHCDSAHRYTNTNIVHAFGNVHINQGDTLHLHGDQIIYHGNKRYAEVRHNVRLVDRETTLITEYLNFDLQNDYGYYPNRGVVKNGDNRLESIKGYYYANDKLFFFRDSVIVTNPDYIINSDTLKYNTVTEVVYFQGPTTITGDETDIYCENGWYDTQTDISQFNKNARIKNNNQFLTADSIYYDNGRGTGKAFMNAEVTDTIENIIIKGNYAWFNRDPEHMFVTDRALLIQMSENDTLYLHADTLRSWLQVTAPDKKPDDSPEPTDTLYAGIQDTLVTELTESSETAISDTLAPGHTDFIPVEKPDSTGTEVDERKLTYKESITENDTVRIMVAYYGARFFSRDMQGRSDSLYYNMRDSVVFMFGDPVIWSDDNQLTAEYMELHLKNGEADHIVLNNSAFITSEEEPGLYNQIKGKDIIGYFNAGELYRVHVTGNAETLYYPAEDEEIIGVNKSASSNLTIFLKENKPHRIQFLSRAEATLYPMEDLPDEERFLQNFQWLENLRPIYWEDVFRN